MGARIEIKKGDRFGYLTIIKELPHNKVLSCNQTQRVFLCKCDCGIIKPIKLAYLRIGDTLSCGCYNKKVLTYFKHGYTKSEKKLYELWARIKSRCYNHNSLDYPSYGGRGIFMYEQWIEDSKSFIDYVKQLPNFGIPNYSIDRINNNNGYVPDNLRWADSFTQALNRRIKVTNTSGYVGISFNKEKRKYVTTINVKGVNIYLGAYLTIKDALFIRNNYILTHDLFNQKIQEY